jgi:hypothetical protein
MFYRLSNNSGLKSALKMLNLGVVAVISLVFMKPRRFGVRPFIAAACSLGAAPRVISADPYRVAPPNEPAAQPPI